MTRREYEERQAERRERKWQQRVDVVITAIWTTVAIAFVPICIIIGTIGC